MDTAKFNLWSGPSKRQTASTKALCAYMHTHIHMCRVGVWQDPAAQHHCGGLAQPSLGKHGAHPGQGQCQPLVSGLALTWALCSYTVPGIHVAVFPPASIPGEGFVVISQVSPWWYCTAPFQQFQVSVSFHLLDQGPYQGSSHSVLVCVALSVMTDNAQSSALGQGKVGCSRDICHLPGWEQSPVLLPNCSLLLQSVKRS